ncbi:MAG: DNA gyrase subunit A [Ardenticatenaceae bacterium]|nr:DNA gyrase subunit A [Ardenticatenaceae bacterium]
MDSPDLTNFGSVQQIDIDEEMRGSYLDYAMSVIVSRALPDVRDGLKPVHRRILYAMYDMGLRPERPYKKSARIVGEVLGKYHPHGDSAVYDAMVRMAQDFSMRYLLVDGQGNFGSVDGDAAAAMRYTEARLAPAALEMLADIEKNTVEFSDNFDGSLTEPLVLPARLPNLLVNGASGIAVGMATNVPPHNLSEVCDATNHVLDNWERLDEITVEDLLEFIQGPDFPTAARILGDEGIKQAYATGRGRVVLRAKAEIEEMRGGRFMILVTELPYQVNKANLIEKIAELVRDGRLDGIADLRDESDRKGMRIVIELKRGAHPANVRNKLFKYTALQSTFGVNMLALHDGVPRVLPLKQILRSYVEHRIEVITRRSQFELERARARAHILEGLLKALDQIDAIIETIRESPSAEAALLRLMEVFHFSEAQARAILDMRLARLAALERQNLLDEHASVRATIAYLEELLGDQTKIRDVIKSDLAELKEKYGDPRRTQIIAGADGSFNEEDLIPDVPVLISITSRNYIKRVPAETYRAQRRGGKGLNGMTTREDDTVVHLFAAHTHDDLLFFTDKGKVYQQRAFEVPDASRTAKGTNLINVINVAADEIVTAAIAVRDWEKADYLVMLTRQGRIKRVDLSEFNGVRPSGLIAINLDEGDELCWVKLTHGDNEIIIVTEQGQSIRFHEDDVRPMGRAAAGVMAIKLDENDRVAAVDVVNPKADLLIITAQGYGKRTPLEEYRVQSRYGSGIRTISQITPETGKIVDARVVEPDDEITLISAEGMVIRTSVRPIRQMGRATRGVKVMNVGPGDRVVSIARLQNGLTERRPQGTPESNGASAA